MYRKLVCCLIASGALVVACGDDDDGSDGDAGSGGQSPTAGGTARAGNAGSAGASAGNGTGGRDGTGGRTGDAGGTSEGGDGGTPPTGDAGSGGTGTSCSADDPATCLNGSTISLCNPETDTSEAVSCRTDFCPTLGLAPGPCVTDAGDSTCQCGDPEDAECYDGADKFCSCFQGTDLECATDAEFFALYRSCLDGDANLEPVFRCFAQNSAQACTSITEQCIAE